jgi:hypothetical protein
LLDIGWREWVSLPQLGVLAVKAKIDTGARTSALHATKITPFKRDGVAMVRFNVRPIQRRRQPEIVCEAEVLEQRTVTSSNGQQQTRYVIRTEIRLGDQSWPIELTLARRRGMTFRMLLGRTAMRHHCVVNPAASYLAGKELSNAYKNVTIASASTNQKKR